MGKYDPVTSNQLLTTKQKIDNKVREKCDQIVNQLKTLTNKDKQKFSLQTQKGTWELKYNELGTKYLRLNTGNNKTYIVSQYGEKNLDNYLEAINDFHNFIQKFNQWIETQENKTNDSLNTLKENLDE